MKRNQIELTEHALIINRRKTVSRRNIRALSWCPDCLIQHGGRETDDRDRSLVLAADLDTPAGRLLNKDPFIVLPLSPDTEPAALTDWAGDLFQDHAVHLVVALLRGTDPAEEGAGILDGTVYKLDDIGHGKLQRGTEVFADIQKYTGVSIAQDNRGKCSRANSRMF